MIDNTELIGVLEQSQAKSQLIKQGLVDNQALEERIQLEREDYQPVALRAAVLYFVVSSLSAIQSMYQHSLAYFRRLFILSVQATTSEDERVQALMDSVTLLTWRDVSKGLF